MFTKSIMYGGAASACLALATTATAGSISVNFHVDGDADAQADHELTTGETAGFVAVDGQFWNNVNVGTAAAHNTAGPIFGSTALTDDMGNATAATLTPSANSTWFVGYAASSAATAAELGLAGNDDDLFNSYLALNGPSGDGSPADAAVLNITGLGSDFTGPGYNLIIYSDSDRGTANTSSARTSTFTVTPGGGSATAVFTEDDGAALGAFDGTYILSDGVESGDDFSNYVVISGLTASSLSIEVTSDDGGRGAISGFQIVAVPEPGSLALLGLGGLMVVRRRRA